MNDAYRFLTSSVIGRPLGSCFTHIFGGGISGLLLGYHLKRRGIPFRIYESSARTGGVIRTVKGKYGIAESAAHSIVWSHEIQSMADELRLEFIPARRESSRRYILRNGKLRRIPLSLSEIAGAALRSLVPRRSLPETIKEFGLSRLGSAATRYLLDPAAGGIYAGDIGEMSFPGTFPSLAGALNKSPFLPLGMIKQRRENRNSLYKRKGTHGFMSGMEELVNALTRYLSPDIELNSNYQPEVGSDRKENIVFCTPANLAANYFNGNELSELLKRVEYLPIVSCTLIFRKQFLRNIPKGFGCLIPRSEGIRMLGVLFNHCIFTNRVFETDLLGLTCILGGAHDKGVAQTGEKEILSIILKELDILFGLAGDPLETIVFNHAKAIPHYTVTLYNDWFRLQSILEKNFPNINLFGNYTGQISIRGMCGEAWKAVNSLPQIIC